ncbi:MAG: restriction endonuclease subunit S [Fibrobacter sp.]|nr:restriction endonuclease subunit S [Fibrobacter sp.]
MSNKNVKWEWKKLKDICEKGSSSVKQGDLKGVNGNYPIYGASGFIQNVDFFQQSQEYIGIVKDGSGVGRTMLLPAKSSVIGTLQYILPKEGNSLKFINYALQNFDFSKLIQGAAIPHIYFKDYGEMDLAVPPIDEQKRIVKVLDETFEKIEKIKSNAQANLQNAKDLFQTTLFASFEKISVDDNYLLKDVAIDFSRGKSKHRPRNDKILFGGEYPFIQTGDIRNADKYVAEYTDTYNEVGLAQSKLWPEGTLCITIAANIAETAVLTIPCCFPDSIIGFVPDIRKTDVDYVYYLLQYFKGELQIMGKGAAQDNLNLGTFEKMKFPFPPLPIQKQIVAKLDSLSEKVKQLESNYKQILADCDELKKATLKKAFEGML